LDHEIADRFFAAVTDQARLRRYCSSAHFSVDGTLLEAWASHKSFKPRASPQNPGSGGAGSGGAGSGPADAGGPEPQGRKPQGSKPKGREPKGRKPKGRKPKGHKPKGHKPKGHKPKGHKPKGRNREVDWRGERRCNDTHVSVTDPEAKLYRKSSGTGASLCFMGHLLTENRNGLIVDAELTPADGFAERDTAAQMLNRAPPRARRRTVGGDRHYDTAGFVADARAAGFTPHVAQNTTGRRSAIDRRTTRHVGYTISQQARKRVEEPFGWIKTIAGGRKLRHKGRQRNRSWFLIAAATYNLVRIARLDTPTA